MNENFKIINPAAISANLMDNKIIIKKILTLYQTQTPIDFEDLRNAILAQDHAEIASRAHHIKPTLGYIGASSLHTLFQELEYAGKNKVSMQDILVKFARVEKEYNTLMEEINLYVSTI